MAKAQPAKTKQLGATPFNDGVTFVEVSSADAEALKIVLFDPSNPNTILGEYDLQAELLPDGRKRWSGHVPDATIGSLYNLRVSGEWDPAAGKLFNEHKLILSPWAQGVDRILDTPEKWDDSLYPHQVGKDHLVKSETPNDSHIPHCIVRDAKAYKADESLKKGRLYPPSQRIIYEVHPEGFSKNWQAIPEELRGKFLGLCHPEAIKWFNEMSITTLELMPPHLHMDDRHLVERGDENYWGYMTMLYQAFHNGYAVGDDPKAEFSTMVQVLKENGIEVIVDVVYNHTAEGNEIGPAWHWKILDNDVYHHPPHAKGYYFDFTGCGNSLNTDHPSVFEMIAQSLYDLYDMGASGVRFDLMLELFRHSNLHFDPHHSNMLHLRDLFQPLGFDFCGEPWDCNQAEKGRFPIGFAEWNKEVHTLFQRLIADPNGVHARDIAQFVAGFYGKSMDDFVRTILTHDGSTAYDLLTFQKYNWANHENNQDGDNKEPRNIIGGEGDYHAVTMADPAKTGNKAVEYLRQTRLQFGIAVAMLAQGSILFNMGSERGHSQNGNNNIYSKKHYPLHWEDLEPWQRSLMDFTRRAIRLRREFSALHPDHPLQGNTPGENVPYPEIRWFSAFGEPMGENDWKDPNAYALAWQLYDPLSGESLLVLANGGNHSATFTLPNTPDGTQLWTNLIDSSRVTTGDDSMGTKARAYNRLAVPGRSAVVLAQDSTYAQHAPSLEIIQKSRD